MNHTTDLLVLPNRLLKQYLRPDPPQPTKQDNQQHQDVIEALLQRLHPANPELHLLVLITEEVLPHGHNTVNQNLQEVLHQKEEVLLVLTRMIFLLCYNTVTIQDVKEVLLLHLILEKIIKQNLQIEVNLLHVLLIRDILLVETEVQLEKEVHPLVVLITKQNRLNQEAHHHVVLLVKVDVLIHPHHLQPGKRVLHHPLIKLKCLLLLNHVNYHQNQCQ